MTDITIPPTALAAAIAAAIDAEPNIRDQLHAACLAMLKAWPKTLWDYKREDGTRLILPLTENNNAE